MPDSRGSIGLTLLMLLAAFAAGGWLGARWARPKPADPAAVAAAAAREDSIKVLVARWPAESLALARQDSEAAEALERSKAGAPRRHQLEPVIHAADATAEQAAAHGDSGTAYRFLRLAFDSLQVHDSLLRRDYDLAQFAAEKYDMANRITGGLLNVRESMLEGAATDLRTLREVNTDLTAELDRQQHPKLFGLIPKPPKWVTIPLGCLAGGMVARQLGADQGQVTSGCLAGALVTTVVVAR
jgi:hypothetical protein